MARLFAWIKRGNSQFRDLLFRRGEPRFDAFDLLSCNGDDLRYFPLTDRKHRLRGVVPQEAERLLFVRSLCWRDGVTDHASIVLKKARAEVL